MFARQRYAVHPINWELVHKDQALITPKGNFGFYIFGNNEMLAVSNEIGFSMPIQYYPKKYIRYNL